MSVCGVASVIGISVNVAIKAVHQYRIEFSPRPHVTYTGLGGEIRQVISEGVLRGEILKRSDTKRTLLKDIMARNSEAREEWRKMDFERRRNEYRANFMRQLERHSGFTLKKIRQILKNGVSLLYRNDLKWYKD